MTRRRAMGSDPLDAIVPPAPPRAADPVPAKRRTTILLPEDLVEQLRDAVVALSGPPLMLTLTDLATAALRRELERLQREHNDGAPFPRRASPLRNRTLR